MSEMPFMAGRQQPGAPYVERVRCDPLRPGNIDAQLGLDGRGFKLIFVRVHFRGAGGTADLTLSLDSHAGEEFDVTLYVAKARGVGADVNLVVPTLEQVDPSPWAFDRDDKLRVQWTNPAATLWAIEFGFLPL